MPGAGITMVAAYRENAAEMKFSLQPSSIKFSPVVIVVVVVVIVVMIP